MRNYSYENAFGLQDNFHVNRTQGNLEMANYFQPWNISAVTYKNSLHVLSCGQFFLNVFVAPPPPTASGLVKPEYYATLGMMTGREQKKNRKRKLKSKLI